RHRTFYTRVLGFERLGQCRACPAVRNHPAEAFLLDIPTLRKNAPEMHRKLFGEPLPRGVVTAPRMPADLVRYFASHSSRTDIRFVEEILRYVDAWGSPRRW